MLQNSSDHEIDKEMPRGAIHPVRTPGLSRTQLYSVLHSYEEAESQALLHPNQRQRWSTKKGPASRWSPVPNASIIIITIMDLSIFRRLHSPGTVVCVLGDIRVADGQLGDPLRVDHLESSGSDWETWSPRWRKRVFTSAVGTSGSVDIPLGIRIAQHTGQT